jgi:hypothetical protein
MPFTPAHAAAAWPLWRFAGKRLDLAALTIGALAPDFEYYVRLFPARTISHQWRGIILLDLPAALLVWWFVVHVMRRRLLELAPRRLAHLADALDRAPRPSWIVLALSCMIGSASHIVWDSFTHRSGWVVQRWPALGETATLGGTEVLPVYKLLQYGSGIFGLAVLALLVTRWARGQPRSSALSVLPRRERLRAALVVLAPCLALAAFAARAAHGLKDRISLGSIGGLAGAFAGLCIWALSRSWLERRRAAGRRAPADS